MKVALFGGTGFVGSYLVDELLNQGHSPVVLVHEQEPPEHHMDKCVLISGSIEDVESVQSMIAGCDAVIYSIGILREFKRKGITFEVLQFEGARRVINVAMELGVRRFILMSANGVKPDGTGYQRTKFLAEEYLKSTDLNWTIFRPSLIFGDPMGKMEFCTQLRNQLVRLPLPAPLFFPGLIPTGAGKFEMSPIHIKDVAEIFVKALRMNETIGKIYELGGPDALDWKSIVKTVGKASGKKKWMVPVPAFGVKLVAMLLGWFPFFPITRDQITMLMEGNTCDSTEVFKLFDISPTSFSVENLTYLRRS